MYIVHAEYGEIFRTNNLQEAEEFASKMKARIYQEVQQGDVYIMKLIARMRQI